MKSHDISFAQEDERLTMFSQTLFEIYRLAREEPIERFLDTMLECVRALIPFQSAWWGRGSEADSAIVHLNSSYLYNLPEHYFDAWTKIRDQDTVFEVTHRYIGQAIKLDLEKDDVSNELRALGEAYQYTKLMCVHCEDQVTCLGNHLSLYRRQSDANFTESERQFFQALMPHLLSASSINQIRSHSQLFYYRSESQVILATCNSNGLLLSAEPALAELLQLEFPDWYGPRLPFKPTPEGIHGKHLVVEVYPRGDQFLLALRPVCAIEQLSSREQEVALLFGRGSTYKEIARELGVSPNTIRYHLRSIYLKLGTSNKADLIRLLADIPSMLSD
ncbi:helix-turn-helix transcriptional regulator [Marinomonas piezotolerans]|uniref:Helix-turn-helix transcriptional regulator n=1 Tax=Marinomonas piezotolerans TaxID=2213058 RepID=A0A370UCZ3_9GAMM|nr:helix-turn-helix transcriptional regulator [Marinomonas piezotolerans]RDL45663.1 helix-turn-helix transcriptional regulator [Marinomonas piezotolerans]